MSNPSPWPEPVGTVTRKGGRVYVVVARYLVMEGRDEEVAAHLREMAPHARSEAGCLHYAANRSAEEPRRFLLFEQYRDEAAFRAHTETEAFRRIVLAKIRPLLAERNVEFYEALDAD